MNIQIFGRSKCFDTRKAQRYFKERRVKYQDISMDKYGMSRGEFMSAVQSVGLDGMYDHDAAGAEIMAYLAHDADKLEKLFENQQWIKTPIVRNGKKATAGYCPDVWKTWE